jgi:hypothetical protein
MTQQINLLDRTLLPVREWCNARLLVGLGAALVLGCGAFAAYETHALNVLLVAGAGETAEPDLAAPHPLDDALAELQGRVASNERLLRAVGSFTDLPQDNAARLRTLIDAMPDSLWLREVEFSVERGLRIAGGATSAQSLAIFSGRLGVEPAFHGLPLHVFALEPREQAAPPADVDVLAATPVVPAGHFGFVLSSVDSARAGEPTP